MLQIAFKNEKRVEVLMIEPEDKPSYSYETVMKIESLHPGERLFFMAGADALKSFEKWKESRSILEKTVVLCADREGVVRKDIIRLLKRIHTETRIEFFSNIKNLASSSVIRKKNSDVFLSEGVLRYIKENEVY